MVFELGEYVISTEGAGQEIGQSAARSYLDFFTIYGFLVVKLWPLWIIIGLVLAYVVYLMYMRNKFAMGINYELFSVTVPPESEKTPKGMEQFFSALRATESKPNAWKKWILGESQLTYSFEIVGINGYVRILFRLPDRLRGMFESHIYAQYPDAEIQEVEDYTFSVPSEFPNDDIDIFGADIQLLKEDAYPIRTYPHFEDRIGEGEYSYIDPLAAFMESLSSLSVGEQVWLQLIVAPLPDNRLHKQGLKLVDELMKRKGKKYEDIVGKYLTGALHTGVDTMGIGLGVPKEELEGQDNKEDADDLPFLSPGEREILKAVEENIAKIGFFVKMRLVYIGKKEVFDKVRFGSAFGGLQLFSTENLNGFKPNKKVRTKRNYAKWQLPRLKRKLIMNYKARDMDAGINPFIFNTEELATVFHFPYRTVAAPTLERAATRSAQPPSDLPME